jgi:hypothetical protein
MIFYIASFPRSGNTWVRNLIMNQFGYLSSPIHGEYPKDFSIGKWLLNEEDVAHYSLKLPESNDLFGYSSNDPMYKKLAQFSPPDGKNVAHRLLLPGFKPLFQEKSNRERLAQEPETYFVKTHNAPYLEYLPGEFVIQIVRHPGASLWSYFNFLRDFHKSDDCLADVITGKVEIRHWGKYHALWQSAAKKMAGRFILVKYENLIGLEMEFCEQLSTFIHLPIISREIQPFEYYHAKNPQFARQGKPTGWEEHYSKEQGDLLMKEHQEQMAIYGY